MRTLCLLLLALPLMSFCGEETEKKDAPLRVLCIGDSITQGDAYTASWRFELWKRLVDSGIAFDMVGTVRGNFEGNPELEPYKGKEFDNEHEGRWGWTAGGVAEKLPDVLKKVDADVALIHLGSNDFLLGKGPDPVLTAHKSIIDSLRADNPDIKIFVAQIIPNGAPRALPDFNKALPAAAQKWSTDRSPVIVVDMATGFDLDKHTYDQLHPLQAGEVFLAERWFDAMKKAKLLPADE